MKNIIDVAVRSDCSVMICCAADDASWRILKALDKMTFCDFCFQSTRYGSGGILSKVAISKNSFSDKTSMIFLCNFNKGRKVSALLFMALFWIFFATITLFCIVFDIKLHGSRFDGVLDFIVWRWLLFAFAKTGDAPQSALYDAVRFYGNLQGLVCILLSWIYNWSLFFCC